MKHPSLKLTLFILFLLLICSFPVIFPYFKPTALSTYDTMFRLTRAAKYYIAVKQLQIPPRWIGDTYHGLGEPIFVYLYPFPYMVTTVLHMMKISFVDSLKIAYIGSFFVSVVTMYIFLRQIGGRFASFIGVMLYVWVPYRLVQLYVRGAYEETMAYIFIPLVILSLLSTYRNKKWAIPLGAISLGLLLLTQSSVSLMFLPFFCLVSILFVVKKPSKMLIQKYAVLLILGFFIGSVTILPNLFERKFIQLDQNIAPIYLKNFIPLDKLIDAPWLMIPTPAMFGKVNILIFLSSIPFLLLALRKKIKFTSYSEQVIFITSLAAAAGVLMLVVDYPFARFLWSHLLLVRVVYVPYLLLQIAVFTTACLAAILLTHSKKLIYIIGVLVFVIAIVTNYQYIKPDYYFVMPDENLAGYDGPLSQFEEFLPKTAKKGGSEFKRGDVVKADKEAEVKVLEKKYNKIIFSLSSQEKANLTIHQFYFPGWHGYIDGKETQLSYTKPSTTKTTEDAGLITLSVPKGEHTLILLFKQSLLQSFAAILTLVSGIGAFIYLAWEIKKAKITPKIFLQKLSSL